MSAVVKIEGTVRTIKPVTKTSTGEYFGDAVSILTESQGILGETMEVVVFKPRAGENPVSYPVGDHVAWVVSVEAGRFGLRGTFKAVVGTPSVAPVGGWPVDEPAA